MTQSTATSSAKITPKRRLARLVARITRLLLILYVGLALMLYALQTSLIFPGASMQGAPDTLVKPGRDDELLHLRTANNTPIAALFGKTTAANPATAPTVLYFYGNAECMAAAIDNFHLFLRNGANCILVDYPGFGMSAGKPSEQACYDAAEAAYQHLLTRTDINTHKLIPAGWSLGGAVAIDLAHRHKSDHTIAALMTFCTFTSMVDLAGHLYPFLPVSLLLQHRFLSEQKIREITVPTFIAHGQCDSNIPFAFADRLAKAAGGGTGGGGPVTRFTSTRADHNDFFSAAAPDLEPALTNFLNTLH